MIEVHPALFVGTEDDYENRVKGRSDWRVVQACKEPYHRQALGYTGRAVTKTHPEYLVARRPPCLILNLVDTNDPRFFQKTIFDQALSFVHDSLTTGYKVLVHCNLGESRGPAIALLYLAVYTDRIPHTSLVLAESSFRKLYPPYNPKPGIRGFLQSHWNNYIGLRSPNP